MAAIPTKQTILRNIVITIDGPAASGKSTTARDVAGRMNLRHIDTGAMYRALTLKALELEVSLEDGAALGALAMVSEIKLIDVDDERQRVGLDGRDVTDLIRTPEISANVSLVSAHVEVRRAMVRKQRELADAGGACLEGRDIGSVVLPWAEVKIFLDATPGVRAARRQKELEAKGIQSTVDEVQQDIEERDRKDQSREVSPLKVPVGARIIDTSELSISDQVEEVIATAEDVAERIEQMVPEEKVSPYRKKGWFYLGTQRVARFASWFLWGSTILRKDPYVYAENIIYAGNHVNNIDPPMIGCCTSRETHFLAKDALFRVPLLGPWIRSLRAVPIRKGRFDRDLMDRLVEMLKAGASFLIFPEGGRQSGEKLGKPRAGIGYLAVNSRVTVIPVYVRGTDKQVSAFFRRTPIGVIFGRPMRFTDPNSVECTADTYRDLGETVMAALQALRDEYDPRDN